MDTLCKEMQELNEGGKGRRLLGQWKWREGGHGATCSWGRQGSVRQQVPAQSWPLPKKDLPAVGVVGYKIHSSRFATGLQVLCPQQSVGRPSPSHTVLLHGQGLGYGLGLVGLSFLAAHICNAPSLYYVHWEYPVLLVTNFKMVIAKHVALICDQLPNKICYPCWYFPRPFTFP